MSLPPYLLTEHMSLPPYLLTEHKRVLLGIAAVYWVIWLDRNNVVFQRSKHDSCLQVIFRSAY
jgi:hypothetical protein